MTRLLLCGIVAGALWAATHQDAYPSSVSCAVRPEWCEKALRWAKHERHALRHRLAERWDLSRPALEDAAFIAARVFGVDPWAMLRVSRCEVSDAFDPEARRIGAVNSSSGATGPAQFLPSTWASTPFARWSPANAYVAMLAMAQIVRADGGFRQWECAWAA